MHPAGPRAVLAQYIEPVGRQATNHTSHQPTRFALTPEKLHRSPLKRVRAGQGLSETDDNFIGIERAIGPNSHMRCRARHILLKNYFAEHCFYDHFPTRRF
jgi:hypothetical protein